MPRIKATRPVLHHRVKFDDQMGGLYDHLAAKAPEARARDIVMFARVGYAMIYEQPPRTVHAHAPDAVGPAAARAPTAAPRLPASAAKGAPDLMEMGLGSLLSSDGAATH